MLRNYLKLSWRNLAKNSTYSIIIISGLVLAYSACLAIFLFVDNETSYDRQSPDADRIYRVIHNVVDDDGTKIPDATTSTPLAPALGHDISQIESTLRIIPTWGQKILVTDGGSKKFYESGIVGADSNMISFLGLEVIAGSPELGGPKKIAITESIAKKYFGNDNPIGKTLDMEGGFGLVTVSTIIADFPPNMHFHYDIIVPLWMAGDSESTRWNSYNYYTYIKLKPGASIADVDPQIAEVFKKYRPGDRDEFYTQPITDIHLRSKLQWELEANGDEAYVTVFITIGVFIFLIAAVNYINLSIVQALNRSKEVGIRKVAGAQARELINQFILEATIISVVSMILAIIVVQFLTPLINIVFDQHLASLFSLPFYYIIGIVLFSIVAGLLSGLYPAVYLSAFNPATVLKGVFRPGSKNLWLRKSLVVLQFAISIALITGSIIVFVQVDYIRSKELGFNKDQLIVVPNLSQLENKTALKEAFKHVDGVVGLGSASGMLGGKHSTCDLAAKNIRLATRVNYMFVDEDLPEVTGMQLIAGRLFNASDIKAGNGAKIILNERAVNDLGIDIESAVGTLVTQEMAADSVIYKEVIGVVKDFHFASLRTEIMPYAFFLDYRYHNYLTLRVNTSDYDKLQADLKKVWTSNAPGPFEYSFVDDQFGELYRAEENFQLIFTVLTAISIYIACSGLFAVASFFIRRRTKEIGIRKALGASVSQVTWLVSSGFLRMVIVANILAWPATWMFMNDWLNGFAYRIEINWLIFLVSGIAALVIAMMTIGGQSIMAAQSNPIQSLRNE